MALYGLLAMITGVGLLISALTLVVWLQRRYRVPYALLTVGTITYLAALLTQLIILRAIPGDLLSILPLGALALGVLVSFSEETARACGYQWLAPGAASRPQALMIGAGHGLVPTLYTALLALNVGLSALASPPAQPSLTLADVSRTLAEALNSLLPVIMHMALSWVVLQAFLRGELGWVFAAIFVHALVEITATLLGPPQTWSVVVWRGLVALASAALIHRIGPRRTTSPGQTL